MNQTASLNRDTCQSCAFFKPQENNGGTCHRCPPQFAGDGSPNESHRWKFPWVSCHSWCGEYRQARVPT